MCQRPEGETLNATICHGNRNRKRTRTWDRGNGGSLFPWRMDNLRCSPCREHAKLDVEKTLHFGTLALIINCIMSLLPLLHLLAHSTRMPLSGADARQMIIRFDCNMNYNGRWRGVDETIQKDISVYAVISCLQAQFHLKYTQLWTFADATAQRDEFINRGWVVFHFYCAEYKFIQGYMYVSHESRCEEGSRKVRWSNPKKQFTARSMGCKSRRRCRLSGGMSTRHPHDGG